MDSTQRPDGPAAETRPTGTTAEDLSPASPASAAETVGANPRVRDLIDELCREVGPRPSGSAAEAAAAERLRARLEAWGLPAATERFRTTPFGLQGLLATMGGCYLLALGVYFVCPYGALSFLGLAILVLLAHRALDLDLPALFLPAADSTNVHGTLAPAGERRRTVLFAGHIDSAFRMPLLARASWFPWLSRGMLLFFVSYLTLLGLSVARIAAGHVGGGPRGPVEWALLGLCGLGAAFALLVLGGMIRRDAVPGANDNLSAVATAWETARRLATDRPRHVEVRVVAFGSEEAGLKGSRDFALRHRDELRDAVLVNLESLGQSGRLHVLTGEMLAGARHAPEALRLVEDAARDAGIPLARKYLTHGLTDAASFSTRGLPAASLIRLNDAGFLDHYHSPGDSPEHVREEHLEEAVRLCLAVVSRLDREAAG
ncbi:MAG: M20/M25/M40 family metallo-hydrolase [Deltaproteobacteria bacterium]|nr:M20/M25/M40 family metallo-hydrolase [Deltaproteobacteria bacterium]